ncbi:TrfA domain protein, putative [Rhizoctonia solani AG-3 Rhs1AP]|uniref:TrfA domain protein, putative n=1 Tax=Rhizoctonia solani AG-3 Rhs1AP TaxID=1086054 RepID=X8IYG9_9AGAM|nr:TrfA domain protein, putative [Rhizoctonia solani AG-3 Rhs1AP]
MTGPLLYPEIIIHQPDSFHPSLSREQFDIEKFMGKWHVVQSTLPLWKSRSDVTITYSQIATSSPDVVKFDDIVEYRSRASPGSARSRIVGVDTLVTTHHGAPEGYKSGVSYHWRGKGWLMIATSNWQVLGYNPDLGWAVTYFSKTLFTPAGLDVYVRDPTVVSEEVVKGILEATKNVGGEIGSLAEDFFEVPVTE